MSSPLSEIAPVLVIDTREPSPSPWEASFTVPTVRQGLPTGDYSLLGAENLVAIERKTLGDLIACFCNERGRFTRELERFRAIPDRWVLCEGSYSDLLSGNYRSQMNPVSAWESAVALMTRHHIPLLMCGDTVTAGRLCESLLVRWLKEHAKVLALVETAARKTLSNASSYRQNRIGV